MKIIQICLDSTLNGKNKLAEADRGLLKKNGHKVTYFEKNIREMNRFPTMKNSFPGNSHYQVNEYSSTIRTLIQKQRPNVLHVYNSASMNLSDLYENCQKLGIAVVQTLHQYEVLCPLSAVYYSNKMCKVCIQKTLLREDTEKKCLRDAQIQPAELIKMIKDYWGQKGLREKIDHYLVPTEFFKDKLVEFGLPKNKVWVKPDFTEEPIPEQAGSEDYVLFIGKLSEEGGIRTLLKAWGSLQDTRLRILGDGPLKDEVMEACSANPNLEFLGWQPKIEYLQHLAHAKILVFPIESCDFFPSTIIKSYAFGVPVVATDLGGMNSFVSDGISGCLFPYGDAGILSEKIDWLLKNNEILQSMKEGARSEYKEKYTSEKNYQILINVYQTALSHKKRPKERTNEFKPWMTAKHY